MLQFMQRTFVLLFIALGFPLTAVAGVTIKMATLAPEGSTWHKGLRKMGEEWKELSGGEVELKIYAGGVVGNETVMLRKMRIGQLHGGAMTNLGLLEIDPGPQVINTPMLIRSYPELDHVMATMGPKFEKTIEENGYVVLSWGDAGWAHLFSKQPLTDPDDVGQLKIFAWEGDPGAVEMYRKGGFKPVVVAATDILPSLQSGLLDSFPSSPLAALAMQWFGLTPNMLDIPWAPLMGAVIVKKEAWEAIPADIRPKLLASARRVSAEIQGQIRKQDGKAVEVMKKYGLKVNSVDDATRARWIKKSEAIYPIVREKIVPADVFDETKRLVDEYRSKNP
jgi:TRAP-type C4-dicarboxylate transport system substrate-binding protein